MVLDLQVEIITKKFLVPKGNGSGHLRSALEDGLGDLTTKAGGGHNQTFAIGCK